MKTGSRLHATVASAFIFVGMFILVALSDQLQFLKAFAVAIMFAFATRHAVLAIITAIEENTKK